MSGSADDLKTHRLCTNPFCIGLLRFPHWHAELISEAWGSGDYDPNINLPGINPHASSFAATAQAHARHSQRGHQASQRSTQQVGGNRVRRSGPGREVAKEEEV